jgi:carboxyl-terminal processing protease
LPIQLEYDSALLLTIAKYTTPSGRLIQRDYSNGGFYDYYKHSNGTEGEQAAPQNGPESRTDLGRTVYGGGGIAPDETVPPGKLAPGEFRLADPVFAFSLELATGRVSGFESYKIQKPIEFNHDLQHTDYPITDALFKEFKRFVASKPAFKVTQEQLDRSRVYVNRQLRFELATAAFGSQAAVQVFNETDPQVVRGIDAMPRARELALAARRAKARS